LLKKYNIISPCIEYVCDFNEYKELCLLNNHVLYNDLYPEIFNKHRSTSPITNMCAVYNKNRPTVEWIQNQIDYFKSLDQLSKDIIFLYSYHGDRIINNYLRNNKVLTPSNMDHFFNNDVYFDNIYNIIMKKNISNRTTEKEISKFLDILIDNIQVIILRAPVPEISFKVYRGLNVNLNVQLNESFETDSFVSTSLLLRMAINFSINKFTHKYGSILEFIVNGNCLLLVSSKFKGELEILLPFGKKYKIYDLLPEAQFINRNNNTLFITSYIKYNAI